jgi:hypothetical protein
MEKEKGAGKMVKMEKWMKGKGKKEKGNSKQ